MRMAANSRRGVRTYQGTSDDAHYSGRSYAKRDSGSRYIDCRVPVE
jgi:hypothetical protein